jgi:hypothetical protein
LQIYQDVFERLARQRNAPADTHQQAIGLMALITGLWLHAALDPKFLRTSQAHAVCLASVQHLLQSAP